MDADTIKMLIEEGSYYFLFCAFGGWFISKALPAQAEAHREAIQTLQVTFKESLERIVETFNKSSTTILDRLEKLEALINQKK